MPFIKLKKGHKAMGIGMLKHYRRVSIALFENNDGD